MKYTVDKKGFYGKYGGAFVPEMLFPNLDELEKNYNKIKSELSQIDWKGELQRKNNVNEKWKYSFF